jgi:hypothetical protein
MTEQAKSAVPHTEAKRARAMVCGVASFILAVGGLYFLGSASQTGRFAGLTLLCASGAAAWLGKRIQYHSLNPKPSGKGGGRYILIAFALAGLLGFLIPPEDRVAFFRYVFLALSRALTQ